MVDGHLEALMWTFVRERPECTCPEFGRAPKDHINMRILQHVIFGVLLVLCLGTGR